MTIMRLFKGNIVIVLDMKTVCVKENKKPLDSSGFSMCLLCAQKTFFFLTALNGLLFKITH